MGNEGCGAEEAKGRPSLSLGGLPPSARQLLPHPIIPKRQRSGLSPFPSLSEKGKESFGTAKSSLSLYNSESVRKEQKRDAQRGGGKTDAVRQAMDECGYMVRGTKQVSFFFWRKREEEGGLMEW